ncbi:MAG: hypothetical protein GY954_16485 [Alteromonas sp.]|nr:hypothetical protein [Alteromonas sp.]
MKYLISAKNSTSGRRERFVVFAKNKAQAIRYVEDESMYLDVLFHKDKGFKL